MVSSLIPANKASPSFLIQISCSPSQSSSNQSSAQASSRCPTPWAVSGTSSLLLSSLSSGHSIRSAALCCCGPRIYQGIAITRPSWVIFGVEAYPNSSGRSLSSWIILGHVSMMICRCAGTDNFEDVHQEDHRRSDCRQVPIGQFLLFWALPSYSDSHSRASFTASEEDREATLLLFFGSDRHHHFHHQCDHIFLHQAR